MKLRQVIIANIISTTLSWYNFTLFALLIPTLSKLFFSSGEHTALTFSYIIFAASLAIRLVGGIIFGHIGDKFGRRRAIMLSTFLLTFSTVGIGLIPTYNQINIFATILLIFLRLMQGIAMGGVFTGSIVYLWENAPYKYSGIVSSTAMSGFVCGTLLCSLVCWLTLYIFGEEQFSRFAWRIPFLFGLITPIAILNIKEFFIEGQVYSALKTSKFFSSTPLYELLANYKLKVIQIAGILLLMPISFYTFSVFIIVQMDEIGHLKEDTLLMSLLGMMALLISINLSAIISNRYGYKPVLLISATLSVLCMVPIFQSLCSPYFGKVLKGYILFAVIFGSYIGQLPSLLAQAFPAKLRYTGVSFTYNLSIAIFGGTTPLALVLLVDFTRNIPLLAAVTEKIFGNVIGIAAGYIIIAAITAIIALVSYSQSKPNCNNQQ